jgi:hypothetical protein
MNGSKRLRSKRAPFFTVGMDDVKGVLLLQSFDRIIGVAKNEELLMEMKRFSAEDPKALQCHVEQGHMRA